MNELALFAGAGGGILGGVLSGFRTVCAVEWDAYCQAVLLARQADGLLERFPIWDNVKTFQGAEWRGKVDVITAGFPCQPFSSTGKRQGENDERNGWPDTIRIIREVGPQYALLENVPGLLNWDGGRYFGEILGELSESGFDERWKIISAAEVGAPHKRDRLWILAYSESSGLERCARTGFQRSSEFAKGSWWEVEPELGRVAHGVAHRVDRLKAIGNGQVPTVAATAFRILSEGLVAR